MSTWPRVCAAVPPMSHESMSQTVRTDRLTEDANYVRVRTRTCSFCVLAVAMPCHAVPGRRHCFVGIALIMGEALHVSAELVTTQL